MKVAITGATGVIGRAAVASLVIFFGVVILAFTSVGYAGIPGWWKWNYIETPPLANPTGAPTWKLPFDFGDHPFGPDRVGLLDVPGGRKQHQLPTPLVGGVGIYLGTLCMSPISLRT